VVVLASKPVSVVKDVIVEFLKSGNAIEIVKPQAWLLLAPTVKEMQSKRFAFNYLFLRWESKVYILKEKVESEPDRTCSFRRAMHEGYMTWILVAYTPQVIDAEKGCGINVFG
jgi:hypothetical protein